MTTHEKIKVLCVRAGISVSELARRLGTKPQNLHSKIKKETFTVRDFQQIAEVVGCRYENYFIWTDGDKI